MTQNIKIYILRLDCNYLDYNKTIHLCLVAGLLFLGVKLLLVLEF